VDVLFIDQTEPTNRFSRDSRLPNLQVHDPAACPPSQLTVILAAVRAS
jgi:hypothetical protein